MIRPPSLQRAYNEYWSEDPSFRQPPADLPESATADEKSAYAAALEEYLTAYLVAEETGNWSGLRIEGVGEPTAFVVQPIDAETYGKLVDLKTSGMGDNEIYSLAFRCALVSVSNLGDAKVSFVEDERLGRIASLSFLSGAGITGAFGAKLVKEIGLRVIKRASDLSPKSTRA